MANEEVWKPVVGYEGLYEISSQGNIKALKRVHTYPAGFKKSSPARTKGQVTNKDGHKRVQLWKDGQGKNHFVHSLLLESFVGLRPSKSHVTRHLNGIPDDNRLENLAWGTVSENSLDDIKHGVHSSASKTHCVKGHRFTESTVYPNKRGRRCIACQRENARARSRGEEFDTERSNLVYWDLRNGGTGLWRNINQ